MKFADDIKLENAKRQMSKYCEYCHHTMTFYAYEKDKKVCSWCGRYNYRNDKIKFKTLLRTRLEIR